MSMKKLDFAKKCQSSIPRQARDKLAQTDIF